MESGGNAALGLIGLWMMLQLVAFLALLLGGIYALFCLGRAASGLDRLASAVEAMVESQTRQPGGPFAPGPFPNGPGAPQPYPERSAVYAPPPVPPTPPSPPAAPGPHLADVPHVGSGGSL